MGDEPCRRCHHLVERRRTIHGRDPPRRRASLHGRPPTPAEPLRYRVVQVRRRRGELAADVVRYSHAARQPERLLASVRRDGARRRPGSALSGSARRRSYSAPAAARAHDGQGLQLDLRERAEDAHPARAALRCHRVPLHAARHDRWELVRVVGLTRARTVRPLATGEHPPAVYAVLHRAVAIRHRGGEDRAPHGGIARAPRRPHCGAGSRLHAHGRAHRSTAVVDRPVRPDRVHH